MPERKSFFRQFLGSWGTATLYSLGFCILAIAMDYSDSLSAKRLAEEGAEAQATVTSLYVTTSHRRHSTNYHYHVGLSLWAGFRNVLTEKSVSEEFYNTLRTGKVIPIWYWTKDPTLLETRRGSFAEATEVEFFLALFAAALTLLFAGLGGHWAYCARWMVRNGVERQVIVTAHVDGLFSYGKNKRYQLAWREPSGTLAASRLHPPADLPDVGETITVLTDPAGRRASIWEGDL